MLLLFAQLLLEGKLLLREKLHFQLVLRDGVA